MNDMANPFETTWFPMLFPFLFIAMWVMVTSLLGFLSGWFAL